MKPAADLLARVQQILNTLGSPEEPLDEVSRQILVLVLQAQAQGQRPKVSDITHNPAYGTVPTVHSRMKKLLAMDMLSTSPSPDDGRSLLLSLTPKATRQLKAATTKIRRAILT